MAYSRRMSTRYPGCVVVLIDQSASMDQAIAGHTQSTRAQAVAAATDGLLDELVQRCLKNDDSIMPWCDVAVLGYGGQGIRSIFPQGFVSTADLDQYALPDTAETTGPTEIIGPLKRWITPVFDGMTPMAEALERAKRMVDTWIQAHPDSFPPVVLNVTDGRANTSDPQIPATQLRDLHTSDGHVLLFNLHLSDSIEQRVEYPATPPQVADDYAGMLYDMSSVIPPQLVETSQFPLKAGARGFVFNGGAASLLHFFMWGTPAGAL